MLFTTTRVTSAQKQIRSNQSVPRAAHQNNEFDERCHPLIMPQRCYAENLVNFAFIQFLRTTPVAFVLVQKWVLWHNK